MLSKIPVQRNIVIKELGLDGGQKPVDETEEKQGTNLAQNVLNLVNEVDAEMIRASNKAY